MSIQRSGSWAEVFGAFLSRVVTTVHWFSDAVVGSWLAIMVTMLLHRYVVGRGIDVSLRFQRDKASGDACPLRSALSQGACGCVVTRPGTP